MAGLPLHRHLYIWRDQCLQHARRHGWLAGHHDANYPCWVSSVHRHRAWAGQRVHWQFTAGLFGIEPEAFAFYPHKLLGFIVVLLILAATSAQIGGEKLMQPVTALYIVGLPLFDMVFTTLRRLRTRRSPFSPDRSHIHHLMQALGMSNRRALLVIGSVGLCSPFLGLMLSKSGATTPYQVYTFFGCFVMYCVLMSQAWQVAERLKRIDVEKDGIIN